MSPSDGLSLFLSEEEGQAEGGGGSCGPYNASEVLNANSDHDSPHFLELLLTPAVGP